MILEVEHTEGKECAGKRPEGQRVETVEIEFDVRGFWNKTQAITHAQRITK